MARNSSETFDTSLNSLGKEVPDDSFVRGLLLLLERRMLGPDYAIAIIGASLVERALESAILSRLVPLETKDRNLMFSFTQKGPLADLGARSRFGLALGLYGPPTFQDLEKIRKIRNLFAHAPILRKFTDRAIGRACKHFNVIEFVYEHASGRRYHELPQATYTRACHLIAVRLKHRVEITADDNITFPNDDELLP